MSWVTGLVNFTKKAGTKVVNTVKKVTTPKLSKTGNVKETPVKGGIKTETEYVNNKTGQIVKQTKFTKDSTLQAQSQARSSAIKTLGVTTLGTGALVGASYQLKDTSLFNWGDDDTGDNDNGGGDNSNQKEGEDILTDESKKSIIEEVLNYLNGAGSGGSTPVYETYDPGETSTSTFSEALETVTQYLPWILGGLVVIFIVYMTGSSNPDKAKAEAVKA